MQILIPMAGRGQRFADKGYTFPKPLIDVAGKPMIQRVVDNFPFPDAEFIFLVQKEHRENFNLDDTLHTIVGRRPCQIITVDGVTEGAACTALLADDALDPNQELIIANSDQFVRFSVNNFNTLRANTAGCAGIIFTFNAVHPKWSFARAIEDTGVVLEVAEKKPISNIATCGIYYYASAAHFVAGAREMIRKNIRTNNEFYIAPVYNEIINGEEDVVLTFFVDEMFGMGTPEDLETFLMYHGKNLS